MRPHTKSPGTSSAREVVYLATIAILIGALWVAAAARASATALQAELERDYRANAHRAPSLADSDGPSEPGRREASTGAAVADRPPHPA